MFMLHGIPLNYGPPKTGGFTPNSLGSKLKAWWNADDHGTANMTDDGAGLISSWTDRIGSLAVTGTTTARPTWASNSFNSSYAGLTFDGTANTLAAASMGGMPTGATAGEIWALVNQAATSADVNVHTIIRYGGTAANTLRGIERDNTDSLRVTDGGTHLANTSIVFEGEHVVGGAWNGVIESGRMNGGNINPPAAAIPTLNTGTTRVRLGATNGAAATFFWQGVIRHVIVTLFLTDLERQQLEAWLAWDVRKEAILRDNHPYRYARP